MREYDIRALCGSAISEEELISIRREFHMYPETSRNEFQTMERIAALLDKWDVPYTKGVATTGIVAHLEGKYPGRNIALRADIDALPITEKNTDLPYCSRNEGAMHACGHDVHTTILLGAVKSLRSLNGEFAGNFSFFFQPDEEDTGGAKRMIAAGCLETPHHIDHVVGLHVHTLIPAGQVAVRYGKMYAASDMFSITVCGKSSHGALPHEGIDAVVIASQIVSAVQTIVSRNVDPTDAATVTFGTIHGGRARNQVCEQVVLTGIIRTLDPDTREFVCRRLEEIATAVASGLGGSAKVELTRSYDPLITDTAITDVVRAVAEKQLGRENVVLESGPQLTVEDFAYYAMQRPSSFYHLGCVTPGKDFAPLHNSSFNVDESCIAVGVRLQTEIALTLAAGE